MGRRAPVLIVVLALWAPGCLCSVLVDPDPSLREGGEGEGEPCDDGVACTVDTELADAQCTHEPDDAACEGGQLCFPTAGCIPLRPCATDVDCADGSMCTTDRCDGVRRACGPPEAVACGDGVFCNGDEVCDPQQGCHPSPAPRDCRDAVDCTEDACDEETAACVHLPVTAVCDDGSACDGVEDCDVVAGCVAGQPACPDDGDCAPEACVEEGGGPRCTSLPDHGACPEGTLCVAQGFEFNCEVRTCDDPSDCDDSDACNGVEECAGDGLCVGGIPLPCDDGRFCTGVEVCDAGVCLAQPAPTCSDGVDCTTDFCDLGFDACAHQPSADACDDGTFCNGAEACREAGCAPAVGFDCEDGSECTLSTCDEAADACVASPTPELCNGLDEDCDGEPDEGLGCVLDAVRPCTADCSGAVGVQTCGPDCAAWLACEVTEDCNGVDDDCDGTTDEGCAACAPQETGSCPTTCGSIGTRTCDASGQWEPCIPPAEVCNGVDDDCSGLADDGPGQECVMGEGATCGTVCGTTGTSVCDASCTRGPCVPPAEACNGIDDDCDGDRDDGFDCIVDEAYPCTSLCGSAGTARCAGTCTLGACDPPPESCSSVDDDCDGVVDETFTCIAQIETQACEVTLGVFGNRACGPACEWGSCCADDDVCGNGEDDDCDGSVDEASCCDPVSAGAELCNGADDDCDGLCDEVGSCCMGAQSYCLTACNTLGVRTCDADCSWGPCSDGLGCP